MIYIFILRRRRLCVVGVQPERERVREREFARERERVREREFARERERERERERVRICLSSVARTLFVK